eukprot:CAMPEP_0180486050 /NCGR_PEP_ID=MMETSP1036_2-20121128/36793_1 /TAXON_ID=632150 /ORGANISM="Azadinium spinosum, Strain 3D9" /LENGTH=277 /DNA_ID=CAMNT_0022493987 /DNA_START=43 /DNA_END=876 /DNA_ORIENTATION=-
MPIDVVKTRLQMDGASSTKVYAGAFDCVRKLVRAEGVQALLKGLQPALLRQSTYGSLRYGLYVPIRNVLRVDTSRPAEIALWKKVLAGASAGAIASAVANPTDLIKVRMQTDGMLKDSDGNFLPRKYRGVWHCLVTAIREEGFFGLWTGVGPTVGRATALAAAELSTYDEVKLQIRHRGIITEDNISLHVSAAFVSGYASTVASSPFDVVKSRIMGQPIDSLGRGTLYRGMVDCFVKLVKHEGPMSLYKGFWPNFGRVVPRVTIVFIVMEQLKARLG